MTIASLIAFAAFTHIVADVDLSEPVKTGLKWSSLAAACFLVFAVQLGVQTLPFLLSGKFRYRVVTRLSSSCKSPTFATKFSYISI